MVSANPPKYEIESSKTLTPKPAAPPGGLPRILQQTRRESHGGKPPGGAAGGLAANPPKHAA
jgi:hypothetical protein